MTVEIEVRHLYNGINLFNVISFAQKTDEVRNLRHWSHSGGSFERFSMFI